MLYADTSALIRSYFKGESDHNELRGILLDGAEPVVTSELSRVEVASAITTAHRSGRIAQPGIFLRRFDADCGDAGAVTLLRLDAAIVLPVARQFVMEHRLRTLDAVHLAVALTQAVALAAGEPVTFVTRDSHQAAAARARGMAVA